MTEIYSSGKDYLAIEKHIPFQISEARKILIEKYGIVIPEKCDNYIARCLRAKDGNLSKAIKLIEMIFRFTEEISGWDVKLRPSLYAKHCYDCPMFFPILTRDKIGRPIFVSRVNQWNPKNISLDEVIVACWMMAQYTLARNTADQSLGFVLIWDMAGTTLDHAWAIKRKRVLGNAMRAQSGVFGRIKQLHVINHPGIAGLVYSGIKPFLSEKINNRVKFHPSFESLHESFDAKHLPTFLGGERLLEDCLDKTFMDGLVNFDKYFEELEEDGFPSA